METTLTTCLLRLADAYAGATGMALSTIGERAAGDWRFFDRLRGGTLNFRVRTFDRAVAWFADNWPPDLAWPPDVPRLPRPPLAVELSDLAAHGPTSTAGSETFSEEVPT